MNELLTQYEQGILQKLNPPQMAQAVQKIVEQGKNILYSDQARKIVTEQLQKPGNMQQHIADGTGKLLAVINHATKNTLPPKIGIPAAMILMCEVIDMLEEAGKAQVTPEFLAACVKATSATVMLVYGVTPEKMQQFFSNPKIQQAMAQKQGGPQPTTPPGPQGMPGGQPMGLIQSAQQGGM